MQCGVEFNFCNEFFSQIDCLVSTVFDAVTDDFLADLVAITDLVAAVQVSGSSAKSRVASVNSATLLLAATFEEFIREMGRQYAREIVGRAEHGNQLPRKLVATAWKRTLEELARAKIETGGTPESLEVIARDAKLTFEAVCGFLEGDTSKDIYDSLIHNENNMRPNQLNSIFSICDLSNICMKFSNKAPLIEYFDETEGGKVHGLLMVKLNDFIEKRNDIAHSLNPGSSSGPEQLLGEIEFFRAVALSLSETLPAHLPQLIVQLDEPLEQTTPEALLQKLRILWPFS